MKWLLILCALMLTAMLAAAADTVQSSDHPYLSLLFSDNMVLQRGIPIPVFGWTKPGGQITVAMNGKTAKATAGADGKWIARLPSMHAGGPYELKISGPQEVTVKNVLIGDVWICSGQSNMEFGIGNGNDARQEIASADYPQIRLFTVHKVTAIAPQPSLAGPFPDLMGQWSVCTPQTVATGGWNGFSAVGYFFGRDLYNRLHVPIGLIHTSWGGTPAEAWTSAEALQAIPDYRPALDQIAQSRAATQGHGDDFNRRMDAWYTANDAGSVNGNAWAAPDFDASSWKPMKLPTNWEDAGLPDYDGVVWFRKEFTLPDSVAGKPITLHLGPIDDRDTTWVNGIRVGGLDVYNLPRDYKIPAGVARAGRNVIAVRVLDTGGVGGINGTPDQMFVEAEGEQNISLAGPWVYQDTTVLTKAPPVPMHAAEDQNFPTTLFNGMIAPLIPYGIKGAIWYQGESNAGKAYQYRTLLPTMITDWRNRWQQGDFPFLIVQLANFQQHNPQPADDAWAELREAQLMTSQKLPHTGMSVTIDLGDANDIHPKDKQDVGKRLALIALNRVYGETSEYSGPAYASMMRDGSAIRLKFTHTAGGLIARGGDRLEGFAIAGADKRFVWADAKIEGDTIVVSSAQVTDPAAVRYAWAINPVCNLYNAAGLPASPFRTDDWPGITVNSH